MSFTTNSCDNDNVLREIKTLHCKALCLQKQICDLCTKKGCTESSSERQRCGALKQIQMYLKKLQNVHACLTSDMCQKNNFGLTSKSLMSDIETFLNSLKADERRLRLAIWCHNAEVNCPPKTCCPDICFPATLFKPCSPCDNPCKPKCKLLSPDPCNPCKRICYDPCKPCDPCKIMCPLPNSCNPCKPPYPDPCNPCEIVCPNPCDPFKLVCSDPCNPCKIVCPNPCDPFKPVCSDPCNPCKIVCPNPCDPCKPSCLDICKPICSKPLCTPLISFSPRIPTCDPCQPRNLCNPCSPCLPCGPYPSVISCLPCDTPCPPCGSCPPSLPSCVPCYPCYDMPSKKCLELIPHNVGRGGSTFDQLCSDLWKCVYMSTSCPQQTASYGTSWVRVIEVHQSGKYVKLTNTSCNKSEQIGGHYLVQQQLGGRPLCVFKFPPKVHFPALATVKVWSCCNSPKLYKPPTDFLFKQLLRWSVDADISTLLCRPDGQAIAWLAGCNVLSKDPCSTVPAPWFSCAGASNVSMQKLR